MSAIFIEDFPAELPRFDFNLIAEALIPLLEQPTEGALVLGVHGPWGSGKTTLLNAVRGRLSQRKEPVPPVFVDFNPWKFQDREALWRALILRLIAELRSSANAANARDLDELEQSLYRAFIVQEKGPWKVNWQSLITEFITIGLTVIHLDFVAKALKGSASWVAKLFPKKKGEGGIDEKNIEQLTSILERAITQRQVDQVQSIEQFLDKFRKVINTIQATGSRVYVLIDDLDRCLPEDALDIFESIKLFLDAPGCVFLVALDRDVIRKGLRLRYKSDSNLLIDPDEYIEKTISVSYDLPRLSLGDAYSIMEEFALPITLSDPDKNLIIAGLGTNPRRIKRFMNTLSFQLGLAAKAHEHQRPVPVELLGEGNPEVLSHYLKLLIISYRFSGVFALAYEDTGILTRLQAIANATKEKHELRPEKIKTEPYAVQVLQHAEEFWEFMRSLPQFQDQNVAELLRWFRRTNVFGD